jgi:hypothetical protein
MFEQTTPRAITPRGRWKNSLEVNHRLATAKAKDEASVVAVPFLSRVKFVFEEGA